MAEAKANVERCEADRVRWQTEVERLTEMVRDKVVDKEFLTETQRTYEVSIAAKNAAIATVNARNADLAMAKANLIKAGIQVKVAEAEERTARALLEYTRITAPYDGVVTARNANKGDYVQGATGDKSTANPSAIFVVERTDILRVFCDVNEGHAPYVQKGTKAAVRRKPSAASRFPPRSPAPPGRSAPRPAACGPRSTSRRRSTTDCGPECTPTSASSSTGPASSPCRGRR